MNEFELSRSIDPVELVVKNPPTGVEPNAAAVPFVGFPLVAAALDAVAVGVTAYVVGGYKAALATDVVFAYTTYVVGD